MRGRILWISTLLPMIAGGCGHPASKPPERERLLVVAAPVSRGPVERVVELTGTVEPQRQTTVFAPVAGWVSAYLVQEGDPVKKDQVVARIGREVPGLTFRETLVKAPISGTALAFLTPEGAEVGPGTPLLQIGDLSALRVRANVPSDLFHKVKTGMRARVHGPGGEWVKARIERRAPVVDPFTGMSYVLLEPESLLAWAPGTVVEVEIILAHVDEALRIPREALIQKDSVFFTFVVENGVARRREIRPGLWGREWVEIRDGLREGEEVVTLGARGLEDGQPVEIRY